jgi:predicted dehydrogenase
VKKMEKKGTRLKVGIVGGGHIVNHRHVPVFKKLDNVEIYGICDKQKDVAQKTADQYGIKRVFTDLGDMLKGELDLVDIATPPKTHVSLATQVMEAGCNVMSEKPLAMTPEEVDDLYRVSSQRGVKLCAVHQNLYNPAFAKARQMVEQGLVGDLICVEVATYVLKNNYMLLNGNHWCHKLPGGIFFEVLPHPVYLLQALLKNLKVFSVLPRKVGAYPWVRADEARALLDSDNGMGMVVGSHNSPYHGDSINIFGTKMTLEVDLWGRSIIKHKPHTQEPLSVGMANLGLAAQFASILGATVSNSLTMATGGIKVSSHYGFIRQLVKSIQDDSEPPVSQLEARDNIRITGDICNRIDACLEERGVAISAPAKE